MRQVLFGVLGIEITSALVSSYFSCGGVDKITK